MPPANSVLYDLAHDVLDAVVTTFAAAAVGLPSRRYVTSGLVAADCEQLVVSLEMVNRGIPGVPDIAPQQSPGARVSPRHLTMGIWLIRCVPMPTQAAHQVRPPSEADLDASGLELATDLWLLFHGIHAAYASGTILSTCEGLGIGPATPLGPEGGFGGSYCRVNTEIG